MGRAARENPSWMPKICHKHPLRVHVPGPLSLLRYPPSKMCEIQSPNYDRAVNERRGDATVHFFMPEVSVCIDREAKGVTSDRVEKRDEKKRRYEFRV